VHKKHSHQIISISKDKATMVKAEPLSTRIVGIYTFYSTRFTVLLMSQTHYSALYVDKAG